MKTETTTRRLHHLISSCLILYSLSIHSKLVGCNPIAFDPTVAPILSYPPVPLQAPMLMASSQYDPYAMQMPHYLYGPTPFHYGPMTLNSVDRAGRSGDKKSAHKTSSKDQEDMTDEQKALSGIPLSFIEPEGPSTIPERISDSFSALGEGVKNHFRSLTENFSDTLDDIKDAWRFEPKKRNSRVTKL